MRVRVNGASKLAASFLLLATLSASADTEESSTSPEPSWAPSIAVTSGFTLQPQKGKVESTIDSAGGGLSPDLTGEALSEPGDGSNWAVSPYVGVNAELMTPEIPGVPGGIRLFVNGEYLPTFAADLDLAKRGDPKGIDIPEVSFPIDDPKHPCELNGPFGQGCACPFGFGCFPEEAITGVGSVTRATVHDDVFGAAVGVAIPLEVLGRKLMLKPSFGWIRYKVDVEGIVLRGIKTPIIVVPAPSSRPVPIVRTVELGDTATKGYNAIGPGLELEMEVHQAGPVQASLFVDAHGYRVLGNRKVRLSDSTTATCSGDLDPGSLNFICGIQYGPNPTDYSARWNFKVDPWLYRVGLGFRFRWTGE